MAARNHIDLVEKTLRVLEALAESDGAVSLRVIARQAGLPKSSAFRILYTLQELSYAEKPGPDGIYRLTAKILALSRRVAIPSSPLEIARPHLLRLRDAVGESVWLAQLRQGKVTIVDGVEAAHALHLRYAIGDKCPLHATALGKAIAAHLPPQELKRALGAARLRRFTPRTITHRSRLRIELARVRQCGFSVNNEETTEGAIIFGSPILDAQGKVFAAISVTLPIVRCSPQKRRVIVAHLREASAAVTAELVARGFRAPEADVHMTRSAVFFRQAA
jgi:IclR family acetate operon transcriptional repressor